MQQNRLEGKNSIIGYLVSLLFHLALVALILFIANKKDDHELTPPPPPKGQQLKLSDFNAPPPMPSNEQEKIKPITKPQPKQAQEKATPKQEKVKTPQAKQVLAKEPITKQKEQNTTKQEKAAKQSTQQPTQPQEPAPQTHAPSSSGSSLLDALNTKIEKEEKQEVGAPIKKLYGKEFDQMTPEQQKFIQDNLSGIGSITQKYLRYPDIAGKMNISGQNVVEFTLYPNGDITDLKLYKGSGYEILDGNSIQTIKLAYKDYPRPSQPTKIRIFVKYSIY